MGIEHTRIEIPDRPCTGDLSACGTCPRCYERAKAAIVNHVVRKRFTERGRSYANSGPQERRYAARKARLLMAMLGLTDDYTATDLHLTDWGVAMRARQRDTGPTK